MPQIYATAMQLLTGEMTRTLGPFESLHAARAAVVEVIGQVLLRSQTGTGGFVAEKDPTLWVVEARPEADPLGGCAIC